TYEVGPPALSQKLFQEALALPQGAAPVSRRGFIGPVLDLDAHGPLVAGVGQGREQGAPLHVTQARQLRRVPAQAQDAHGVQAVAVDARVLGVDVDDPRAEVADATDV